MKNRRPLTLLCAVAAVCGAALELHASRPAQAPAAGQTPPPSRADDFKNKFKQALEINAKEEILKLVRTYQPEVVDYVVELCESLPDGTSEQKEKELHALNEAWKTDFKSGFVDHLYNFFSLVDPRTAKELNKLFNQYRSARRRYADNMVPKVGEVFEQLGNEFEGLARQYQTWGHLYNEARAWNEAALCFETVQRGPAADLERVAADLGFSIAASDKIELNNAWYQQNKLRWETLVRAGKAAPTPAAGAAPAAPAAAIEPSGPMLSSTMQFELVPTLDTFERPSYTLDDIYNLWQVLYLTGKGSSVPFQAMGKKPKVFRESSAVVKIDGDGDDKPDTVLPTTGNKTVWQFSIGEGADKRPWACLSEVGTTKDTYQGLAVNLAPDDNQFSIYFANAASVVGTFNGTKVRVIDDNQDGVFGSAPLGWQYVGLTSGALQPDLDAIVVGDSKRARPWSEYQEIGGAWYKMEQAKSGTELHATPVTVELGKLSLEYKGDTPPAFVVVKGKDLLANTYIDLLQNGGADVPVPVGTYELYVGTLRKGKKAQIAKALMLPGKQTPTWSVEAGKTVKVKLGAPYSYQFESSHDLEKLTIVGHSVVIVGAGFERYERLWNCVTRPEVSWRKAGSKKGSKPEKMNVVGDLNEVDDKGKRKYDYVDVFFPLNLELELKLKEGEKIEMQLAEKKNKLFGSIESPWIE